MKWCIERENPVLPKTENDKPVQFWQLRKNGAQVGNILPFAELLSNNFVRPTTTIVCYHLADHTRVLNVSLVATKTPQANAPELGRGALCADSMGLWVSVMRIFSNCLNLLFTEAKL